VIAPAAHFAAAVLNKNQTTILFAFKMEENLIRPAAAAAASLVPTAKVA
jgi:hypothetical protein